MAYVELAENTMIAPGKRLLPNQASLSVFNLRSRLGHVSPFRIDTVLAMEALRCLPPVKVQSFRNKVSFLSSLIADRGLHGPKARLLPREPVGPLPGAPEFILAKKLVTTREGQVDDVIE